MSAEIQSAVYSAREGKGWHGIGKEIPAEIRNDPAKIAALLGATFTVDGKPVFYQNEAGQFMPVPGYAAQVRSDSGDALSITSDNRYFTANRQPKDIFEAFRDEFAANRMELSHGAILKGGRLVVASALLDPEFDIVVGKGDRLRRYATLSTGYDNRNGTIATDGDIRVVCWNTWSWAISKALQGQGKVAGISASQKIGEGQLKQLITAIGGTDLKGVENEISEGSVAQVIANIKRRAKLEQRMYDEFANARMDAADVLRYFSDVLEVNVADLDQKHADGRAKVSQKMQNLITTLTTAYHNAPGAAMAQGTAWGAFNAVTYYATHQKPVRDTTEDGEQSARVASNLFGDAKRLKVRALSLALSRVKVAA